MDFKESVTNLLLEKGEVASEGGWTYGWQEFDYRNERHDKTCGWVATEASEVIEFAFSEFQDTFTENQDKVILALTHVNCNCGKKTDKTIGIEGGAMDLLHNLLGIKKEYRW